MGNFAPMTCPYCGAGPYSGVTLGDRHDDPDARSRWYDCETFAHFNTDMPWTITEQCADRALKQKAELSRVVNRLAYEFLTDTEIATLIENYPEVEPALSGGMLDEDHYDE